MSSPTPNVLSTTNKHERDTYIQFFEKGHKYSITTDPTSSYTSVTTWNHSHFPKFDADEIVKKMMSGKNWKEGHKYWGMTAKQIKAQWSNNTENVAGAGTKLHYDIECFMNNPHLPKGYTHKDLFDYYYNNANTYLFENKSVEWEYFIQFVKDHPDLKPYRTEWMVYNEDVKLAGSIDMVYENPDGKLSIYDWKRSKEITKVNNYDKYALTECVSHLPDSNFWHYALQLNTYKEMLEQKYGKKVSGLYLVRLHPDAEEQTYELLKVPVLKAEMKDLFKLKKSQL